MKIIAILLLLFSLSAQAADFTITVEPSDNSVGDAQVSQISSNKIINFASEVLSSISTTLANYLLKSDIPDCPVNQVLTKNSGLYSCVAITIPSVPTGTIIAFSGSTCPAGYLAANGSSVSRSTYDGLFNVINTLYGSEDLSSFNLPNTQGLFLRGAGSQTISGLTYSSTFSQIQSDQFQSHVHAPSLFTDYSFSTGTIATVPTGGTGVGNPNTLKTTPPLSDGTNGSVRTGSETRPANLSVNFCIKI